MKKVVNSALASALAVTLVPAVVGAEEAAATTAAPAMDPALTKVVKRLEALKLVAGYGNGDYGVERTITRAEFATLVARARGLEQGAKLAQYQTNFTDVKSSDWFAGFVNIASTEELVKGYTDNTFKPQNNVTYAEAVAMIIRALGYEPSVKGVWPNNYISKASELGVAKTIATPNNAATRGDVFKMLDNALNIDLMKQVEYGTDIRFEVQPDKSLLTEYLDVKVYDMDWADKQKDNYKDLPFVSNTPVTGLGSLKANEVTLADTGRGDGTPQGLYKVADGVNVNEFAGQHVQVWIKDDADDVVVWMEGAEDEDVINDLTDTFYIDGKTIKDEEELEEEDLKDLELLLDSGKTYDFSEDVIVTYNFKRYGDGDKAVDGLKEIIKIAQTDENTYALNVKLVLDDQGKIAYIHAVDHASADQRTSKVKYGSEVIEKISAETKKIENLEGGTFTDLRDKEEGEDFLVFLNGAPAKLADLKPMDVYSVFYADGKRDRYLVMAYRNVVEGKVDDVQLRSSGDYRLKIGDTVYRFRNASYSENGNKDVEDEITRDQAIDLDGEEVKIYLGGDGRIRHIETKDDISDRKQYALLTKSAIVNDEDELTFQVLTESKNKDTITLEVDDIDGKANGVDLDDMEDQEIVDLLTLKDQPIVLEITYDKDGKEEKAEYIDITTEVGEDPEFEDSDFQQFTLANTEWEDNTDKDDETVKYEGTTYEVNDDTVVFDMHKGFKTSVGGRVEIDDPKVGKFSSIAEDDDKTVVTVVNEDEDVEFMFIIDGEGIESDWQYGLVKDLGTANGDNVTLLIEQDGKVVEKDIPLDDDLADALDKFDRGDFISYTLNADDELEIDNADVVVKYGANGYDSTVDLTADGTDEVHVVEVEENDGDAIEGTDGKTYELGSKVIYLDADGAADNNGVDEGDFVVLIDGDDGGNKIDYVVIVGLKDDIKENDTLDEYREFVEKYNDEVPPVDPGDWDAVKATSATGTKVDVFGTVLYKLEVELDVDGDEVESAVLEFEDGTEKEVTVDGDTLVFEGSLDENLDSATLTITNAEGKEDTVKITFEDRK